MSPQRFVRDQLGTVQNIGEQGLAQGGAGVFGHVGKAVVLKRRGLAFDDKRAAIRRKTVVVRVQRAKLCLDKALGQGIKRTVGAEPRKVVGEMVDLRGEIRLERAAHQ